jgi:type VI secretion system Hcp family effector
MWMRSFHPAAIAVCHGFFCVLHSSTAGAQISAWLDFGGAIQGEATDARHKGWIDILAFHVGSNRPPPTQQVGGGVGAPGKPSLSEMAVVKWVDRASPALFAAATTGSTPYEKVTIDLNSGSRDPAMPLLVRLELGKVLLSALDVTAAANSHPRPTESISLNFEKITFIYYLPDGSSTRAGYDLATNTASSGTEGADSDGDGMPDDWERYYGLIVGVNDADEDMDGDGFTNLQEYQLGTRPDSGTSFFKAELSPVPATPGSYRITWNSVAGKTYVIEWSPDLVTPFTALRVVTATAPSTTETLTHAGAIGFFRVRPQ